MHMNIGKINWKNVKEEKVSDLLTRQIVYGEKVMVARLLLKKGCVVPAHSHDNEQITWVQKGSLELTMNGRKQVISAGDVLVIPSNVLHEALAAEDTEDIDIFSPPRMDWITGKDAYLRDAVNRKG